MYMIQRIRIPNINIVLCIMKSEENEGKVKICGNKQTDLKDMPCHLLKGHKSLIYPAATALHC